MVAKGDPAAVLSPFKLLALRRGFTLSAYGYTNKGNRRALVVGLPAAQTLVEPPDDSERSPPIPEVALHDPMGAIVGDGSDESYLQSSVLARELDSLYARGHAVGWRRHQILDVEAWPGPPLTDVSPSHPRATGSPETWT